MSSQTSEATVADETGGSKYSDVDCFFILPDMKVSQTVKEVVELSHQCMIEATEASSRVATVMYHTARDVMELIKVVVPLVHAESLNKVPRTALLYHNDCFYAAHHLTIMAHKYRDQLPGVLAGRCITVDMVPSFREEAEKVLKEQLEIQHKVISDLAVTAPEEGGVAEVERCGRALKHHIDQMLLAWDDMLPFKIKEYVFGVLCTEAMASLLGVVSNLEQVSRDEARNLHRILVQLRTHVDEVLEVYKKDENTSKHYQEFCEVTQVFEPHVSLSILGDMFTSGRMNNVTLDMTRKLAMALFRDDEDMKLFLEKVK